MKAIVVTDRAAGTAGMQQVARAEADAAWPAGVEAATERVAAKTVIQVREG
jgi:hypothetical protein